MNGGESLALHIYLTSSSLSSRRCACSKQRAECNLNHSQESSSRTYPAFCLLQILFTSTAILYEPQTIALSVRLGSPLRVGKSHPQGRQELAVPLAYLSYFHTAPAAHRVKRLSRLHPQMQLLLRQQRCAKHFVRRFVPELFLWPWPRG